MNLNTGAKIIGQGITGAEGSRAAQWMLEYGTNLVAGVTPGKGGQTVCGTIPVFNSVREAQEAVGHVDATVVFAPPMRSKDAVIEAIDAGVQLLIVIAEKIPTGDGAFMYAYAKKHGAQIIGPNTTGIINPSKKIKIGLMVARAAAHVPAGQCGDRIQIGKCRRGDRSTSETCGSRNFVVGRHRRR